MRRSTLLVPLSLIAIACGPRAEPSVVGAPIAPTESASGSPAPSADAPMATSKEARGPSPMDERSLRDQRHTSARPRSRALLVAELQGLRTLLATMALTAPDRPEVLRRMAEDYVELAHVTPASATADVADARREAIATYTQLATDHASYPQRDAVIYYLAYELEASGDRSNARKRYFELIQKYPQSTFIPSAYLGFAEMFFDEATKGDTSKLALAEQAYKEVLKYPPPANTAYGYASYKLANVRMQQGDYPAALALLKKTIDFGVAFRELPNAERLANIARKDAIPTYALVGDPAKAFNFLRTLSDDPPGSNEKTFQMMGQLGSRYIDGAHFDEASILYQDLRSRDPAHACAWAARMDDAQKQKKGTQTQGGLDAALAACPP
jgi:tetratricopeptide (TPR) repeat protein